MVAAGLLLAAAWSSLSSLTAAKDTNCSARIAAACEKLQGELGSSVILRPSDAGYDELSEVNWSQTAWRDPACIAQPGDTAQVQAIVKTLSKKKVPFAVRSGGHSPNPLDANIDEGVLLSLNNLNKVVYDAEKEVATIGSGGRWIDVYTELQKDGVVVVGGRVPPVGVGGLILGSGLSYHSDLYGMACDNIVSYEVVLADGSVVEASESSHPDLWWALKGGANNFGIVTEFRAKAYPQGNIWGSLSLYSMDQMDDVLQAYEKYHTAPNKDLNANMVMNIGPINDTVIVTLVYLKPEENPEVFAPFYGIPPVLQQSGIMSLTDLMTNFPAADLPRWTWYTSSFEPKNDIFTKISDFLKAAPETDIIKPLQSGTLVATIQPINENVVLAGEASGGNALNLKPVNQTWIAFNVGWANESDDEAAYAAIESLHERLVELIDDAGVGLDFIFMNDANIKQPVIASYGAENVQRMLGVRQEYDPDFVFEKLVKGGQKIPS